jgi:hypothetical protein
LRKTITCFVVAVFGASACHAATLTPVEERWLQGAWPVLLYARDAGLPLDIVVQPQPAPGLPPLALAYIGQRCKLVFSLRGNPEVAASTARIEPDLFEATLQLMAAHEMGHCWRHVRGDWYELPAGQAFSLPTSADASYQDMQAVRREEGYADLVGLAWTRAQAPPLYARLHAWLMTERSLDRVEGSHHDTLPWVRLAANADTLGGDGLFEAAASLWKTGLAVAR